ncbi:hypothetical protein R80B4_02235 [Fibrobacteres bacterium R8-0-B4]
MATGIGTPENPFGVTLEDVKAYDRERRPRGISNSPVRDIERESFWDFMNKECPGDGLTPEVIAAIKGE